MGDPAGIGPEITVRAMARPEIYACARPLVIGSRRVLERVMPIVGQSLDFHVVRTPEEGLYRHGVIDVLDMDNYPGDAPFGVVSAKAGQAAFEYIRKSIDLSLAGDIDGVATSPIQKEAIHMAGIPYIGHTEMYCGMTGSPKAVTMFHVNAMRIFFLSRHMSLIKACQFVTYANVLPFIENCHAAMKMLGVAEPRLAVAALNPHGGEGGLCGDEEVNALQPAVEEAVRRGIKAFGPIPADSVFRLFDYGRCDAVLSLYHDQGHIAAKVHDYEHTVSVTVGLPFVRVSVDHGTAFDIAGKGIASSVHLEESIEVAAEYAYRIRPRAGA
jgi:4-hydroxythreonine-4-phosphate dehydrogenase